MKIKIPNKIQTSHGEVEILPYASRDKFMKGLVEGWKAAMRQIYIRQVYWFACSEEITLNDIDTLEFIEGEE